MKKYISIWNRKPLSVEARKRIGLAHKGKHLSEEHKEKLREFSKGFPRPDHSVAMKKYHKKKNKEFYKEWSNKLQTTMMKKYGKLYVTPITNAYSRSKRGHYDIGGVDYYFRSLWEANYALYLNFLVKQKEILRWEFEADTFWFENIKRGVRSYLPDFKIFKKDGTIEYHEIKGWMDSKSKTKIKRLAKYYPDIKLIIIDSASYNDIKGKLGKMLRFYT